MTRARLCCMGAALLAPVLASCVSPGGGAPSSPPETFAHRVATAHVVLYWDCARAGPDLFRMEGVAQNPWYAQEVRFLELDLVGVDSQERPVSRGKAAAQDILIRTNQFTPFRLELRPAGSEVRFDLYYQYWFQDVEMETGVPGSPRGASRLLAQTHRFIARDACSDTKHRAR